MGKLVDMLDNLTRIKIVDVHRHDVRGLRSLQDWIWRQTRKFRAEVEMVRVGRVDSVSADLKVMLGDYAEEFRTVILKCFGCRFRGGVSKAGNMHSPGLVELLNVVRVFRFEKVNCVLPSGSL